MSERICTIDDCGRSVRCKGLCAMHYAREFRRLRGTYVPKRQLSGPAIERLRNRIVITPGPLETPCWISTYAPMRKRGGYTKISVAGRAVHTHRFTYETLVGPIPEGLELDHLCRVPACCNPTHLEPVTGRENKLRTPRIVVARSATICKAGHPMADAAVLPGGGRRCRQCHADYERERKRNAVT